MQGYNRFFPFHVAQEHVLAACRWRVSAQGEHHGKDALALKQAHDCLLADPADMDGGRVQSRLAG